MCDFQKFKEKVPDKSELYSSLSGKIISDEEYKHVLKVWKKFKEKK